jgi:hypothetical protein
LQLPPLDLTDVSLLLVIGGIVLLITAELLLPYGVPTSFARNKKRLENAATATGILFLATMIIRIIGIMLGA